MVTVPMQIHISMGWFLKTVVLIGPSGCGITRESRNGIDPSGLGILRYKLDSGVNAIDVMEEIIFACRTQDDTSVIHIPLPHFGRVLGSLDGFYFKVLHEKVGHYGADGYPMAVPLICSLVVSKVCFNGGVQAIL